MGAACSRKRESQIDGSSLRRAVSKKYGKSASWKWLLYPSPHASSVVSKGEGNRSPSLMELCARRIREVRFIPNFFDFFYFSNADHVGFSSHLV